MYYDTIITDPLSRFQSVFIVVVSSSPLLNLLSVSLSLGSVSKPSHSTRILHRSCRLFESFRCIFRHRLFRDLKPRSSIFRNLRRLIYHYLNLSVKVVTSLPIPLTPAVPFFSLLFIKSLRFIIHNSSDRGLDGNIGTVSSVTPSSFLIQRCISYVSGRTRCTTVG